MKYKNCLGVLSKIIMKSPLKLNLEIAKYKLKEVRISERVYSEILRDFILILRYLGGLSRD